MTWDFFAAQMERLNGLKFRPPNLQTHWEALKDMPDVLLEAAVTKAQPECDEFPSPKMLKVYADQLRGRVLNTEALEDRTVEAPDLPPVVIPQTGKVIPITRHWRYYCDQCSDIGWRSFVCGEELIGEGAAQRARQPWLERRHCGRRGEHGAHSWSEPCPCAATNPDVQRRKQHAAAEPPRGQAS